jgi:hypothetical protein
VSRGIIFTVLQPVGASYDDVFAPLVDEALLELAEASIDHLAPWRHTFTASNGVRIDAKLISSG